jgi:hypothetical protein
MLKVVENEQRRMLIDKFFYNPLQPRPEREASLVQVIYAISSGQLLIDYLPERRLI